jgi:hypothetical protein
MKTRDAYEQFFKIFPKDDFFKFGLENIITVEKRIVDYEWKILLDRIYKSNDDLFVRSFGRNGNENNNLNKLYKEIFNINIKFDPTNNAKPRELLQKLTDYKINKTIFNYQTSHVFGNTKNVFCFTALWNIVFLPKIIDPFTGHEAQGNYVDEFQKIFRKHIFDKFEDQIVEYNELMQNVYPKIELWVNRNIIEKKRESYLKEFKQIKIN